MTKLRRFVLASMIVWLPPCTPDPDFALEHGYAWVSLSLRETPMVLRLVISEQPPIEAAVPG